jgi:putative ABC transport system permease protein
VDGVLLKPLPYVEPDRIVRVLEKPPGGGRNDISTLNYLDWQKDNTVFDFMAAQTGGSTTLTGNGEPTQLRAALVSPHYFDIFGIQAVLGRTFAGDEDQIGNATLRSRFSRPPYPRGGSRRSRPRGHVGVLHPPAALQQGRCGGGPEIRVNLETRPDESGTPSSVIS